MNSKLLEYDKYKICRGIHYRKVTVFSISCCSFTVRLDVLRRWLVERWDRAVGISETSFIRDLDERRVFLTVLLTGHSNLFERSSVIVLASAANFRICLCELLKWRRTSWFSFAMARAAGTKRIASAAGSTRTWARPGLRRQRKAVKL